MIQDLGPTVIVIILIAALMGHVALIVLSKWYNPLFILAGVFMVLTPLGASDIVGTNAAKLARVYVTVLMVFVPIVIGRQHRLGPAVLAFLAFAGLYWFAGIWSEKPITAFKYKGLFILLALSGALMAYSINSERELRRGLRFFIVIGAMMAAIMLSEFIVNPSSINNVGRFQPWGMNPTRVGSVGAPMGIMCAFIALYDPSKPWKLFAFITGGAFLLCIVYSGNRSGMFMAAIGTFIVAIPVVKRPVLAGSMALAVALLVWILVTLGGSQESTERFGDFNFETREGVWGEGWDIFREAVLFGKGWVFEVGSREGGSTRNLHNMYLQIAAEMGIFGLVAFVTMLVIVTIRGFKLLNAMRIFRTHIELAYLGVALALGVFAHGMAESGPLMGGTINAMLLPFGLAMIDRVPELMRWEAEDRWAESHDEGDWPDDDHDGWDDHPHDDAPHDPSWESEHGSDWEGDESHEKPSAMTGDL